ncbi:DNA mismatch repair endonuclease MutL [Turneriella parva]|uniref:DNA mismatch repair protein MutL n=1 Tax=Turneriella parva (strain ATCC BAA-1111 / DSM 21527 / NCTC 11395 / H) TaxID=869212 RepID=I4B927_TURPD|nr:DNA mismatch repair endonuclease MutL [Turneriella parva]AFM13784.1 DNA mismatch repair protein MutL [Turneriella parva DSM 21527]
MSRIQKLDAALIAQIAAGEVIESPAAIVKELVENALDAGATSIDIRVLGDGFDEIQVRDNGTGIVAADLELAVTSFATSKISSLEDLLKARTMGFRGEALGSIASVSRLTIESRSKAEEHGSSIQVDEHGRQIAPAAIDAGTRVVVRDLFYNVPVRRDYYQNVAKTRKQLSEMFIALAVASPGVAFRYDNAIDEPVVLSRQAAVIGRMQGIWGEKIAQDVMPLYHEVNGIALEGYISRFYFYRTHASDVRFWVNRRPVVYKPLVMLLRNAYGELMPKGRFPFAALFLSLPETEVDVNVHPQKREVRFRDEKRVLSLLRDAFHRTISEGGGIAAHSMVRMPGNMPATAGLSREEPPDQRDATAFHLPLFEKAPENFTEAGAELSASAQARPAVPQNLVLHSRIFNTFIVATNDEGLFLIDQHTAHERINYERFLRRLAEKRDMAQQLATPVALGIAAPDRGRILAKRDTLAVMGFMLEDLGPAGLALTSVPSYLDPGEEGDALQKAVAIIEHDEEADSAVLFDQLAKDLSCRHAIRKGETASLTDFAELIDQLRRCASPLRCPHGRPTIVRIDEREIFSYFKRQV